MNKDQLDQWKDLCDDEFVSFFHSKKTEMSCLEEPLIFLDKLRDCDLVPDNLYQELMKFFHCKKTEISCMEEPNTFLSQLRDHNLVPELLYQKVIKMKSKERKRIGVYEILDRVENNHSHAIEKFWSCVFQDHILQKYPILRILRNSLLDGSFKVYESPPDAQEPEDSENESGQKKEKKVKRKNAKREKRKESVEETVEDEEEPGPSTCSTPTRKKGPRKPMYVSPLKRGEKAEIWTWDFCKTTLPVTCGDKTGTLHRGKLAKGLNCILHEGEWVTPNDFERFAGKGSSKNWKISIRCQDTPLLKLIQGGHLQSPSFKRRCVRKSRRISVPLSSSESSSSPSESDEEMEESDEAQKEEREEGEEQREDHEDEADVKQVEEEDEDEQVDLSAFEAAVLPVSCGSATGELYKKRFAGGSRSKSIRTEECWFTPEEFVKQESTLKKRYWKRDIMCHGKTLHYLLTKKVLYVHCLLCECDCCHPNDALAQNNDDVCFICNSDGELVCCDECPRAFHQDCHLPTTHSDTDGDKWSCTFCVWKFNQRMWVPMSLQEAFSCPLNQNIMRCQYLLLCLYKEFTLATVPGHRSVISSPIGLSKVKTNLQKNVYSTVGEFVDDIRLVFRNCEMLNKVDRLSEIFEQMLLISFKIQ